MKWSCDGLTNQSRTLCICHQRPIPIHEEQLDLIYEEKEEITFHFQIQAFVVGFD